MCAPKRDFPMMAYIVIKNILGPIWVKTRSGWSLIRGDRFDASFDRRN